MAKKRNFFLILAAPKWKIPSEQNGSSDKLVNLRYAFFSPCPPAMQSDGLGCQSGFRSLHSTLTALLEATNAWSVNIDNGLLNGVVFIDLTKAFDTIDHEIILRKMSYLGVDQAAIKWFSLYLSGRNITWFDGIIFIGEFFGLNLLLTTV